MTTRKNKTYGGGVEFVAECDSCNEILNTHTADFKTAINVIKNEGWKITKMGEDWLHYCSQACTPSPSKKSSFNSERSDVVNQAIGDIQKEITLSATIYPEYTRGLQKAIKILKNQ